jgi:hypothetical protein
MVSTVLAALALTSSLTAAPPLATRQEIIDRAKPAVGYSYWWGGGCWRNDDAQHGSCSGNCPDCTHSGSYGADCSGYVFKAWQIDGASAVSACNHGPYTAASYHNNETHWSRITRANAKKADILASTTHVVILETGDPWGTPTVLEARGCSYGVQRNTRSFGSTYNASQRDNLGAPPPPPYKATFVSQTFPVASAAPIVLKEGDTLTGQFIMKNDGANAWTAQTKLAPTPRDVASPLADASWLSPTRIVSPGAVAAGQSGTFAFTIYGGVPGEHVQTFGLVQEGTTWFANSGGPSDDQLAIRVLVQPRDHAATALTNGFALDDDGFIVVAEGRTVTGQLDVRNDGHVTWDDSVRLAPTPRDVASSIAAPSWLSPSRVTSPDGDVAEGEVAHFTFEIAGNALGEHVQTFGLVHENVTWFADAGFGPSDDFVTLQVRVVPAQDLVADAVHAGLVNRPAQAPLPPSVETGCAQTTATSLVPFGALSCLIILLHSARRAARPNGRSRATSAQ